MKEKRGLFAMARWSFGVDLGGTKIEIAIVDETGSVVERLRMPTDIDGGSSAVEKQILEGIDDLRAQSSGDPVGIGIGIAAQIDDEQGVIRNAPNLKWKDVPFQENLKTLTKLPVRITNDVRAAAWGEWLFGAGQKADSMVCLFVGTGIGSGVIINGEMLTGCSNTAGEVGHMIIRNPGDPCHCGSQGCFESVCGGWAIGEKAQKAVGSDKEAGSAILKLAGGDLEKVSAKHVADAFDRGDPLAKHLVDRTLEGLVDGCVNIVNAFNPCRFILGGGVIEGLPHLVDALDERVKKRALAAATENLVFEKAALGKDAGVVGAAALTLNTSSK